VYGILPHELLDCTLQEFLFDLAILSNNNAMTEEELRVREEWYREMLEGINDG
jgi:hypothetical protein